MTKKSYLNKRNYSLRRREIEKKEHHKIYFLMQKKTSLVSRVYQTDRGKKIKANVQNLKQKLLSSESV